MSERGAISRMAGAWNRYWYRPAPVLDLAIVRLALVALHQLVLIAPYTLMTVPLYEEFDLAVQLPAEHFQPVAVFRLLTLPFGAGYRPTVEHLEFARWATLGVGFTALVGLFTRTSLALYTLGFAFMISHRYSYGDYHHLETAPVLTLAVLACAPAGRALSLDAWRRRRARAAAAPPAPLLERTDPDAAWAGKLIAWLLSMIYLSAALSKLGGGGWQWMNGFTVQASLLQAACFWDNDAGLALAHHHGLMHVLTWFTMLFEGLFFLILIKPRWAPWFALVAAAFHIGSMKTMSVPFALYLPCFAILMPWTEWIRRLRGLPPLTSSAASGGAASPSTSR